ncbi:MAG: hypothetical protein ACTSVY_16790 [Candidatus Helarchaeota archaeon]
MVNWDDNEEQIFWIRFIITVISSVLFFFLMQLFTTSFIKNIIMNLNLFTIGCLLITFVISPITILIFNKIRKTDRPPLIQVFLRHVEKSIIIFIAIYTLLFFLNIG